MGDALASFDVIRCPSCLERLIVETDGSDVFCGCGATLRRDSNILFLCEPEELARNPEAAARDREAGGYLQNPKFPTQISNLRRFVDTLPARLAAWPALDLGCGPGPTTGMLLAAGYQVVAVDFSAASLRLNAASTAEHAARVLYVAADLNELSVADASCGVLMMADFLQHLGDRDTQARFIRKIAIALVPGGMFFLSFFNYNIKNMLKRDRVGTFSAGAIRYRRSQVDEVVGMFPDDVELVSVSPMNIFHGATADRIATNLPFAFVLARMVAIVGRWRER